MPKQYEAIKRKHHGNKSRAAKIYVGKGKTKRARSQRAKMLKRK